MRFKNYLNEATKQDESVWSDMSWSDIWKNKKEFKKWIKKKNTQFYYNQWKEIKRGKYTTTDENGNKLILEFSKSLEMGKSKGSKLRTASKTKRVFSIELYIESSKLYIDILDIKVIGEDPEKIKKYNNNIEKTKDLIDKTFGIKDVSIKQL